MKIGGNAIIKLGKQQRNLIDLAKNSKGQTAILSRGIKNPNNYDIIILSDKMVPLNGIRGSKELCLAKFERFQNAAADTYKKVAQAISR